MMLRETLQEVLANKDDKGLCSWCRRAKRSRLESSRKLATTILVNWERGRRFP